MRYKNAAELMDERMHRIGDRIGRAKATGYCTHGWQQGTPGKDGPVRCLDCGATWATQDEAYAANKDAMRNLPR